MEKKKNCIKDIYIWLESGRQKACSVKCDNEDIQKLLTALEEEFERMFTYSESYKVFYGEGSFEKALKSCQTKVEKLLKEENEIELELC